MRIVFQLTPGTEAPAEMNFLFPDRRALCMAENATHNLHNLLTLRGALVRDAAHLVALPDRGDRPVRRRDRRRVRLAPLAHLGHATASSRFLSQQRDLYAYLHDQTLRLMNQGHTGTEIAEMIELPPALEQAWHTHGYYGSVSHNVKAIYQRYLGWFDGNPAHLWQHPPVETRQAVRRVSWAASTRVVAKARRYVDDGDLRFAAQLLNHAVFADPSTRRGHGAAGRGVRAARLRRGERHLAQLLPARARWSCATASASSPIDLGAGMVAALTVEQIFDSLAIRVNGAERLGREIVIDWMFTDLAQRTARRCRNGVLIQQPNPPAGQPDLTPYADQAGLPGHTGRQGPRRHHLRRRPRCPQAPDRPPRRAGSGVRDRDALTAR